jgi:hypothetical protein
MGSKSGEFVLSILFMDPKSGEFVLPILFMGPNAGEFVFLILLLMGLKTGESISILGILKMF